MREFGIRAEDLSDVMGVGRPRYAPVVSITVARARQEYRRLSALKVAVLRKVKQGSGNYYLDGDERRAAGELVLRGLLTKSWFNLGWNYHLAKPLKDTGYEI